MLGTAPWRFGLRDLFIITLLVGVSLAVWQLAGAGWGLFTLVYSILGCCASRCSLRFVSNFTWAHLCVFLVTWFGFTVLTLYILSRGLDDAQSRLLFVLSTSVASVSGPLTGAISRGFQGCCLEFSVWLMPYCATGLGIALLVHVSSTSSSLWMRSVRLLTWTIGLFIWFAGGIVSFGHALS